jgi:hypothetical protein
MSVRKFYLKKHTNSCNFVYFSCKLRGCPTNLSGRSNLKRYDSPHAQLGIPLGVLFVHEHCSALNVLYYVPTRPLENGGLVGTQSSSAASGHFIACSMRPVALRSALYAARAVERLLAHVMPSDFATFCGSLAC